MSVVRVETADTTENRVTRDFLERCFRASGSYLRENISIPKAFRVIKVRRLRNRIRHWLKRSDIRLVSLPVGIPQPNYVLQFDDRYSQIWYWYERLRRQQTYEDDIWRWQHQTWAEHASLAFMHAFSRLQGQDGGFRASVYLRSDQLCGRFIDDRSSAGTWLINRGGPLLIESFVRSHLSSAAHSRPFFDPLYRLGPDFVAIAKRPFQSDDKAKALVVWSSMASMETDKKSFMDEWLHGLVHRANGTVPWDRVTPALIMPLPKLAKGVSPDPVQERAHNQGASAVSFLLPNPVHLHLSWLAERVAEWAKEGGL